MQSLSRSLQPTSRLIRVSHLPCRISPLTTLQASGAQTANFSHARPILSHVSSKNVQPCTRIQDMSKTKTVKMVSPARSASTSASTKGTSPHTPQETLSAQSPTQITWTDFFRLRLIRRRLNLAASIITTGSSFAVGAALLSSQNLETLGQPFGLDPMVVMGLWVVAFTGAGWLVGPGLGSLAFGLLYRSGARGMKIKEKDFYGRIKRFRVDPSTSSVQNPVPDYYGEKITSVGAYRSWLKDQRAFRRKRQSFI